MVKATIVLDDELFKKAQALTGCTSKSKVVRRALDLLIQREAARRLASIGGISPNAAQISRRRPRRS